jgi:hypothetical protein
MNIDDALVLAKALMWQHKLKGWAIELNPRLPAYLGRTPPFNGDH